MMLEKRWILPALILLVILPGIACADGTAQATKEKAEGAAGSGSVAARVGDQTITLEEVDAKVLIANAKVFMDLYDARRAALDQMIAEILVGEAATAAGITQDELIQREVISKVETVGDAEIESFYNQNKDRMGGRSLEEMRPQLANYLNNQRHQRAVASYMDGLKKQADLQISLDPPRTEVKIAENDPTKGPDSAPVKIVLFSEFQ